MSGKLRNAVLNAITQLDDKDGSSFDAIQKYINSSKGAQPQWKWRPCLVAALHRLCRLARIRKLSNGRYSLLATPPRTLQKNKESGKMEDQAIPRRLTGSAVLTKTNPPKLTDAQLLHAYRTYAKKHGIQESDVVACSTYGADRLYHARMLDSQTHEDYGCMDFRSKVMCEGPDYYYGGYANVRSDGIPYDAFMNYIDSDDPCWCGGCTSSSNQSDTE